MEPAPRSQSRQRLLAKQPQAATDLSKETPQQPAPPPPA